MVPTPDTTPDDDDPGDETARRYRYQWTYSAGMCCLLLDETQDGKEVFCEHHEDILVKRTDGRYSGLQIKTRGSDQEVWKTTDEALVASFVKFAMLEAQFPDQFRDFQFLTNHPLYSGQNGRDICHVLREIQAALTRSAITNGPISTFIKRIAREAGCSEDVAFNALKKSSASGDLPKFADVKASVIHTLTRAWAQSAECSYDAVTKAATELIRDCADAASLAHDGLLPVYLPLLAPDAESEARLAAKRFDKQRVLAALERGMNRTAHLHGNPESMAVPGAGSPALLEAKLDAGGFSAVSLNSAKDLRDKADYLGIAWTKKLGREHGLQRYNHIRSLVLRDAAEAFEATRGNGEPFGPAMLSELRARFRARRRETGGLSLHDCSDEHLEGIAFGWTSECLVFWSLDRPWERGQ